MQCTFLSDTGNKNMQVYSRTVGSKLLWSKINQQKGVGGVVGAGLAVGWSVKALLLMCPLSRNLRRVREEPTENLG